MVDRGLLDYVKSYLSKGYTVPAVRAYLLRYGYSAQDVDEAIKEATTPEVRHVIHLPKQTIIAIAGVMGFIVITSIVLFLVFSMQKPEQTLLDISLSPITTQVKPGENVEFTKEISNLGAKKRYDIMIEYKIIGADDGKFVYYSEETLAVETKTSSRSSVKVPADTAPGNYLLKASAKYDTKNAVASFAFKVYEESAQPTCSDGKKNQDETGIDCGGTCGPCPSCDDEIQNQGEEGVDCGGPCDTVCSECPISCEDANECTTDVCSDKTNYLCKHEPKSLCCGNNLCETGEDKTSCPDDCKDTVVDPFVGMTDWEKVDAINQLSYTDPLRAAELCKQIAYETARNKCYQNLAGVVKSPDYCDYVIGQRSKDNCLSNVATVAKNSEVCGTLSKESRSDACYMSYAMENKDFSVCEKIVNEQLKESCDALSVLNTPDYQNMVNAALARAAQYNITMPASE